MDIPFPFVRLSKRAGWYGMPEYEMEERVEKYWEKINRQLSTEDEQKLNQLMDALEEQFVDPTEQHPVKAVDVAKWFDPTSLIGLLKPRYPCFTAIKNRFIPRFRFFAYLTISQKKSLRQAYLSLSDPEFKMLGFPQKPQYELLREFLYERIGVELFPVVFHLVVQELAVLLKQRGIQLGARTFQDATDARALKHDPDAKYSGYYKESGYKLDVTIDAEREVPLDYLPMEITADEGKNLIPSQEHLESLKMQTKEHVVDDKYATYENIARSELHGTAMIYKIAKNWVYNTRSTPGDIKMVYQRYHQENDFIPGADLEFMLHYLHKKGETEIVGAVYRNQRMTEREENPEGYDQKCNERGSRMEGFFGRVKTTTILDDHPGRRGWKGFLLRAGLCMLALVFAALIRVQNGVLDHLTNVTYIIT
jgi:hypothetical protein